MQPFFVGVVMKAMAHGLYEPLPDNIFEYKFDWDPTLVFFLLIMIFYVRGLRTFKKKPVRNWQIGLFFIGVIINVAALSPPIDPLSDRLFFMHMVQHLAIILLGSPLMIMGAPFNVIIRSMKPWTRRNLYFPFVKNIVIRTIHNFFSKPIVSLIVFNLNFWFWHLPRWYNLALLNDFFHLLEHAMMALTSIYLWRNIVDPKPLKSDLHMGLRILFLAAFMALNIILAGMLTYADELWYAYEGIPMPSWWAERWTHLDDQRLGGIIMWVPGGFITFMSMTICFFVWVAREKEKERNLLEEKRKLDGSEPVGEL